MHKYLGQRNNAYFLRVQDLEIQMCKEYNIPIAIHLDVCKNSVHVLYTLVLISHNLTELNLKHACSERSNSFLKYLKSVPFMSLFDKCV